MTFEFRFEPFGMIDEYPGVLDGKDRTFPDGCREALKEAEAVRSALDAHPAASAPCHCDPLCGHVLDDGSRMWIVDWEHPGMSDPLRDPGNLSVEAGFSGNQDREMTDACFDANAAPAQYGRMVVYKAMCDLPRALWGLNTACRR